MLKARLNTTRRKRKSVSVLYREPKLLKALGEVPEAGNNVVSVLYREPKLLKFDR